MASSCPPQYESALTRCPENRVQKILTKDKIEKNYGKNCENLSSTEYKERYIKPIHKKPASTREALQEQFYWHEIYAEYLRDLARNIVPNPIPKTEYTENYEKDIVKDADEIQEQIDRYPIYGSIAISFYNPSGDKTRTFRKSYSITRPVSEQSEQFG